MPFDIEQEHVVHVAVWQRKPGPGFLTEAKLLHTTCTDDMYDGDDFVPIVPRTELTFDGTGRVIKQVMWDGVEFVLAPVSPEALGAPEKGQS